MVKNLAIKIYTNGLNIKRIEKVLLGLRLKKLLKEIHLNEQYINN